MFKFQPLRERHSLDRAHQDIPHLTARNFAQSRDSSRRLASLLAKTRHPDPEHRRSLGDDTDDVAWGHMRWCSRRSTGRDAEFAGGWGHADMHDRRIVARVAFSIERCCVAALTVLARAQSLLLGQMRRSICP